MSEIAQNLESILQRIIRACVASERLPSLVQLVAVSKTFSSRDVQDAINAGQACFGESKLQEAETKIGELVSDLDWHFIGRVQRNKVRKILPLFSTIHAVDSLRLAEYMNGVAQELGLIPKIFLQVDQAGEITKGGFRHEEMKDAMPFLMKLKHLKIIGLMSIPPAVDSPEEARPWFRQLRELRDQLEARFSVSLPSLSMGMSGDFEVAIEEGATHVRVGSSIFGKRSYRVEGELGR